MQQYMLTVHSVSGSRTTTSFTPSGPTSWSVSGAGQRPRAAYESAIGLATNVAERAFLERGRLALEATP